MEYRTAAVQVATEASAVLQPSKKACSGGDQKRAQPALQYCGNCGRTRHNARTCKKDTEISSESDVSITYAGSLFNSDEIKDA
jgi:hypothetical protein